MDGRTDRQTTDKVIPKWRFALLASQKLWFILIIVASAKYDYITLIGVTSNIFTASFLNLGINDLELWPWKANSENSGPLCGEKFDPEVCQMSRSLHTVKWKGLSQGSCKPYINALSLVLQKIWARFKFMWHSDKCTDGQRFILSLACVGQNSKGCILSSWVMCVKQLQTLFCLKIISLSFSCYLDLWPSKSNAWQMDIQTEGQQTKWSLCGALLVPQHDSPYLRVALQPVPSFLNLQPQYCLLLL